MMIMSGKYVEYQKRDLTLTSVLLVKIQPTDGRREEGSAVTTDSSEIIAVKKGFPRITGSVQT